ncbi:hypothetical protein TcasGA2_TC008435 [Tribolium castaneum]|uniref:Protein TsetseEP domain-containing protein n=2 Tax=Tribolium castaneum TaxID=7070 RepID=D2A1Z9_TRICA|nr:hypothetical protein TcasGA2_TC008435 [Tribolium castaneum]
MFTKVVTLLCIVFVLKQADCLTQSELQAEYRPTLLRLRDVANLKYQEATREYDSLVSQLNLYLTRSKNNTQTQINRIKNIVTQAAKNATGVTASCLKVQQNDASRLSTYSLNNCNSNTNFSTLQRTKSKFTTLANVASNSVNYCSYLNPLDTQIESNEKCLGDKIYDLNLQINRLQRQYEELSNSTLHYNINCLTDKAGAILSQIGVISYEINVCFFTP